MSIKNSIRTIFRTLVGDDTNFSLEARIFNAISFLSFSVSSFSVVAIVFVGISNLFSFVIISEGLFFAAYYLSRVKKQLNLSIVIFQLTSFAAMSVNYMYNSGIDGPSMPNFIILFAVSLAVSPKKQYVIWLPLNLAFFLGLTTLEYYAPELIPFSYSSRSARFLDTGITYFQVCAMLLLISYYITDELIKVYQATKQHAKALEESNNVKNKLLSVLAHDLKEPLASIQSFLELLADFELDPSDRKEIEKGLLKKTQDTSFLLANMLSWTRNQMDSIKVNLENVRLKECLSETIDSLHAVAHEKNIELDYIIPDSITVYGDRNILQVVVRNLIMNAIKYTNKGGFISVFVTTKNDLCTLSVKDNGIGISAEKQKSLFSLGIVSTAGTGREKGAGLGLILCNDFMNYQGGSIGFSSQEQVGSTFFITLPNIDTGIENSEDSQFLSTTKEPQGAYSK